MEYFVTGNLKHDGREYERGALVDIANGAAELLLAMGVIQTDPIASPPPAPAPEPEDGQPQPEVAGKALETGEPSIDGEPERGQDKAEDITPVVAEPEPQEG